MMKTEYKYWFYYLKTDYEIYDKYSLYAYTDDKELSELFESFRDMEFFKRVVKKINREDVNYIADQYTTNILEEYEITSYDKKNNQFIKFKTALTRIERLTLSNSVNEVNLFCTVCKNCWLNPLIYSDNIYDALKVLRYNQCYKFIASGKKGDYPKIVADELGIFIRYYGKTIKMNKVII